MKNTMCPICGEKIKESFALKDGNICMRCANDLRFEYPLMYLPEHTDLQSIPQCQQMNKTSLAIVKKYIKPIHSFHSNAELEKKMNQVFDDEMSDKEIAEIDPSYTRTENIEVDLMHAMTIKQFAKKLESADAFEDQIRQSYQDYTNVCVVEDCRPLRRQVGKPGIQNLKKLKSGYCLTGWIVAGQFKDGDRVGIVHEDQIHYADIIGLDVEQHMEDQRMGSAENIGDQGDRGRCIRAGYQVTIVLNEKAKGIQPGDWIVMD